MQVFAPNSPAAPSLTAQLERVATDLAGMISQRNVLQTAVETAHREILIRLCRAAAYKDDDTSVHIERIGFLSSHLARLAGLPAATVRMLRDAAPMHDIGKIGIPDAILQKPGALTPEEWVIMRQHPAIGAELLKGSSIPLLDMAAIISLTHHENFDGSGYPRGLAEDDIPIEGRIVALVDYFDALSMDRCYRPAWPFERVLESIIEQSGRRFDPMLVQLFVDHIDEFVALRNSINELTEDAGDAEPIKILGAA